MTLTHSIGPQCIIYSYGNPVTPPGNITTSITQSSLSTSQPEVNTSSLATSDQVEFTSLASYSQGASVLPLALELGLGIGLGVLLLVLVVSVVLIVRWRSKRESNVQPETTGQQPDVSTSYQQLSTRSPNSVYAQVNKMPRKNPNTAANEAYSEVVPKKPQIIGSSSSSLEKINPAEVNYASVQFSGNIIL